jgi:hypothetical protein
MSSPLEVKYRLRINQKIVGYLRKIDGKSNFYSPDGFWWSGRKIDYKEIDEWTGYLDKNRTPIYEWDILHFKIDPDAAYCKGVVLWEANQERFVIRNIDDECYFPFLLDGLQLFSRDQLNVFSHLFLNPDLKEHLGIEDD